MRPAGLMHIEIRVALVPSRSTIELSIHWYPPFVLYYRLLCHGPRISETLVGNYSDLEVAWP